MTPISNYNIYTTEMTKAIMDKMFFADKIDADLIVDYGCADGTLIAHLKRLFPDMVYMGYDNDPKMVEEASTKLKSIGIVRGIYSDWDYIEQEVKIMQAAGLKTAIVLSSLIHEIYSYCDDAEIYQFWERVYQTGFDYIVIRDMAWVGWQLGTRARFDEMVEKVRAKANPKMLEDFENVWGKITYEKNLMHFLLKYRYEANWARELHENYLPIHIANLLATMPEDQYKVAYKEFFGIPFIAKQVQNDFDIVFDCSTHVKLIMERKD